MKLYKFAEWDNFPLDQEILEALQNYYQSGLNTFFESLKPSVPFLVGGAKIISGSIETGGVIGDGLIYHPDNGLMLLKGGAFVDDAGYILSVNDYDLEFEGGIQHPAEIEYIVDIDNNAGNFALATLLRNRWWNQLSELTKAITVTLSATGDAYLAYRFNPLSRQVTIWGHGKWGYQEAGGTYAVRPLGTSGFEAGGTNLSIPAGLRPPDYLYSYGTILGMTGAFESVFAHTRIDGTLFEGCPVSLATNGLIKIAGYRLYGDTKPVIRFQFSYQV